MNGLKDPEVVQTSLLPEFERTNAVYRLLTDSLHHTLMDTLNDWQGITRVSNPQAYYDLLRGGEKIVSKNRKYGKQIREEDFGPIGINSQLVAALLFLKAQRTFSKNPNDYKNCLQKLKKAQPALMPGETAQSRAEQAKEAKERKLMRERYVRTLSLAAVAGGFALSSFLGARANERETAPEIARIGQERIEVYQQASPQVQLLIDAFLDDSTRTSELLDENLSNMEQAQSAAKSINDYNARIGELKSRSNNSSSLLGTVALGALARFGYWRFLYSPRPYKPSEKSKA